MTSWYFIVFAPTASIFNLFIFCRLICTNITQTIWQSLPNYSICSFEIVTRHHIHRRVEVIPRCYIGILQCQLNAPGLITCVLHPLGMLLPNCILNFSSPDFLIFTLSLKSISHLWVHRLDRSSLGDPACPYSSVRELTLIFQFWINPQLALWGWRTPTKF